MNREPSADIPPDAVFVACETMTDARVPGRSVPCLKCSKTLIVTPATDTRLADETNPVFLCIPCLPPGVYDLEPPTDGQLDELRRAGG